MVKKDDLFQDENFDLENMDTNNIEGETVEEEQILSRKEMKEKLKRGEIEPEDVADEDIDPDELSVEAVKAYKRKVRTRKLIAILLGITLIGGAGYATVDFLKDSGIQQEETIETLTGLYGKYFSDEERTEIIAALKETDYSRVKELFDSIPESTDKMQFRIWQEVLDTQFENQQNALQAIATLIEEIDGKHYVSSKAKASDFDKALKAVEQPFNKGYQAELAKEVEDYQKEFEMVSEVREELSNLYNSDNVLVELTSEDLTVIDRNISDIKNPNTQKELSETYDKAFVAWDERNRVRQEKAEREAEQERIRAEEQARIEEEIRQKAEEEERIRAEERARLEAQMAAEEERRREEEAERAAQEALEKEQEEEVNNEIGVNMIGINGTFKPYVNLGQATTEQIQNSIDAGNIASALNVFSGTDNKTTYFAGHNPGVLAFMEPQMTIGSTLVITDSEGIAYSYKMTDKVDVDVNGKGVLKTLGREAIDVYSKGTNEESVLIQYCNTSNDLMSFWYGVRQ